MIKDIFDHNNGVAFTLNNGSSLNGAKGFSSEVREQRIQGSAKAIARRFIGVP